MNTLWFIAMLVGIGWLMVWSVLPPAHKDKFWFPFDMPQDRVNPTPEGQGEQEARKATGGRRGAAGGSWRQHVASSPAAGSATPSRRTHASSWRRRSDG